MRRPKKQKWRELHFERLEERNLLTLVVTSIREPSVSVSMQLNAYYRFLYPQGVQEEDEGFFKSSESGPAAVASVAFGDHFFMNGGRLVKGAGNASISASITFDYIVQSFAEENFVTRYVIDRFDRLSVDVSKSRIEPFTPPADGFTYVHATRLSATTRTSSGSYNVAFTDPSEFILSADSVVVVEEFDNFESFTSQVTPNGAAGSYSAFNHSRDTILVSKRPPLSAVTFEGNVPILPDPGTTPPLFDPSEPIHYLDVNQDGTPEQRHPILYAARTTPVVTVEFKVQQLSGASFQVRGEGPDGLVFVSDASILTNDGIKFEHVVANKVFGPVIKKYDDFKINWEISSDGGANWTDAGSSSNTLYVSAQSPKSTQRSAAYTIVASELGVPGILFETVVDVAISTSEGRIASERTDIVRDNWAYFEQKNAARVDGTRLKYWGGTNFNGIAKYYSTPFLLRIADGPCDAWAHFFLDVLAVNGITADEEGEGIISIQSPNTIVVPAKGIVPLEFLLIQDFVMPDNGGRTGIDEYPYFWNATLLNLRTQSEIKGVTDIFATPGGGAGQNNSNPPKYFDNHATVSIAGQVYDPSYGKSFADIAEWENESLAGFIKDFRDNPVRINEFEAPVGHDLDGNGLHNDRFLAKGFLARRATRDVEDVYAYVEVVAYEQALPTYTSTYLAPPIPVVSIRESIDVDGASNQSVLWVPLTFFISQSVATVSVVPLVRIEGGEWARKWPHMQYELIGTEEKMANAKDNFFDRLSDGEIVEPLYTRLGMHLCDYEGIAKNKVCVIDHHSSWLNFSETE